MKRTPLSRELKQRESIDTAPVDTIKHINKDKVNQWNIGTPETRCIY
jgi:hypothetical protein